MGKVIYRRCICFLVWLAVLCIFNASYATSAISETSLSLSNDPFFMMQPIKTLKLTLFICEQGIFPLQAITLYHKTHCRSLIAIVLLMITLLAFLTHLVTVPSFSMLSGGTIKNISLLLALVY